jgi:hypothetical protein
MLLAFFDVKNAVHNVSFLGYVVLHDLQQSSLMVPLGVVHSQKNGDWFSRYFCALDFVTEHKFEAKTVSIPIDNSHWGSWRSFSVFPPNDDLLLSLASN